MSEREPATRSREAREARPLGDPVRFGSYILHKRIAVGGMSEVYLGAPESGTSPAAELVVKRLLPSVLDDPRSRHTFQVEASLHAAARHPNVVQVFDAGEVNGEPYLAMEYVAGVDTFRLMRRAQTEARAIPSGLGLYIACELCKALECVHALTDATGNHFGIVHRDVTPSNIYLSHDGDVKLGDFGIARSVADNPRAPGSQALKGKYAYLAPEQVSGEPFDHRADLFSLAVVLAEMLIGQPLFAGAGQLAVLLAIRDCRIDPLRSAVHLLPKGLFPVLERALAKAPEDRFSSAADLYAALLPFQQPSRKELRAELAVWVKWAGDPAILAKKIEGALRDPGRMRAASFQAMPRVDRPTIPAPAAVAANVRTREGRERTDLSFAKLIELIVTGELVGEDEVAMNGHEYQRLDSIDVLARHLPPSTATTSRVDGPGVPDYAAELATTPMLDVLGWLLARRETGAIFADRHPSAASLESVPPPPWRGPGAGTRKELYLDKGKLVLVASSEPRELLGEHLVRQGVINRDELDTALVALPRYDGRLGDTLIGLGLVDPVEVFRAIQSQGRSRVAEIFRWTAGRVSFYRGVTPQRIDFRLDLDIPELMYAGLEESISDAYMVERHRHLTQTMLVPVRPPPAHAMVVAWPSTVLLVMGSLGAGRRVGELLTTLKSTRNVSASTSLRAIEVAHAGGLLTRQV